MFVALLALLFFLVPFAEIFVIVEMTRIFGNINTVLLMVLLSSIGAWLVKREGLGAWGKVTRGIRAGRIPTADVVDGFVLLIAGVLMLTPGFITGTIGLVVCIPPVREVVTALVLDLVRARGSERFRLLAEADAAGSNFTRSPFASAPFTAPRPYRRPEDSAPSGPSGPSPTAAAAPTTRSGRWSRDDIIDVEGEEWFLDEEPLGEIGPA